MNSMAAKTILPGGAVSPYFDLVLKTWCFRSLSACLYESSHFLTSFEIGPPAKKVAHPRF